MKKNNAISDSATELTNDFNKEIINKSIDQKSQKNNSSDQQSQKSGENSEKSSLDKESSIKTFKRSTTVNSN